MAVVCWVASVGYSAVTASEKHKLTDGEPEAA